MNSATVLSQLGMHTWLVLPALSLAITVAVMALIEDFQGPLGATMRRTPERP